MTPMKMTKSVDCSFVSSKVMTKIAMSWCLLEMVSSANAFVSLDYSRRSCLWRASSKATERTTQLFEYLKVGDNAEYYRSPHSQASGFLPADVTTSYVLGQPDKQWPAHPMRIVDSPVVSNYLSTLNQMAGPTAHQLDPQTHQAASAAAKAQRQAYNMAYAAAQQQQQPNFVLPPAVPPVTVSNNPKLEPFGVPIRRPMAPPQAQVGSSSSYLDQLGNNENFGPSG